MLDVPADLLGSQETNLELGIVDHGFVGPFRARDLIAGLGKEVECRLLETTRG
jgi:hypothetical protein